VATFAADGTFSNSSGMRITFPVASTGGLDSYAVIGAHPFALSGAEAAGLYKLLVRIRRSGGAAGVDVWMSAAVGALPAQDVLFPGGTENDTRVIDVGYVPVPCGQPVYQANPGGAATTGAAAPQIDLTVWKTPGNAGVVDLDWIALVPADDDLGLETVAGVVTTAGSWWMLDGYDHTPRVFNGDPRSGGSLSRGMSLVGQAMTFVGGAPRVQPGNNRLYVVGGLGGKTAPVWAPSTVVPMHWYYWPRFLGLR
jgi:hypothetical protein